jgi:hypothetical protein
LSYLANPKLSIISNLLLKHSKKSSPKPLRGCVNSYL